MRPHSRQILTVEETFGANGWHCELIEGRDVLRANFEAHHTRVDLIAQAHPQINALSVVSESPMPAAGPHLAALLELLARANKPLTLGAFEYDIDRSLLIFRITNLFERERFDADIVSSMVHCAIAELDRGHLRHRIHRLHQRRSRNRGGHPLIRTSRRSSAVPAHPGGLSPLRPTERRSMSADVDGEPLMGLFRQSTG